MANKKMTALCMAAMLAASLGSVASASESGITRWKKVTAFLS